MALRTVTLELRQHLTPVLQRLSITEQDDLGLFVAVRTCLGRLYAYPDQPVSVEMSVQLAERLLAALEGAGAPEDDLDDIRDALALEDAIYRENLRANRPARATVRGSYRLFGAGEEDLLG